MYPSGVWRGFWEQRSLGRQPMRQFLLHFRDGEVTGHGADVVGRFVITGEANPRTGRVRLVKQYLGQHQVLYDGGPDGEGCIHGTWTVRTEVAGRVFEDAGPFLLTPDLPRPTGDEPIQEIG